MKAVLKIYLFALVLGIITFFYAWSVIASAAEDSNKFDGGCPEPPAYATVGRCADKCPDWTWTLLGFDKETGKAICKAPPTGCPYGDSIPLGPDCDRLAPQQPTEQVQPTANVHESWGK